ncbi:EpsI family protein [Pseudoduganella flava]|uniref:EpsI family protein n=1 Tax=Pseudoduganella flava TaxID=871742 RepID=A0A562Q4V6_9BURK|nr:exosortase-associated protein EpsI, B-type [Pseudoduganella flava]QGZ41783.1 EpsI family protein [Pseudoduganella flava]TWI51787.1 EpsI family protein [Pseudoduganella flava]
MKKPMAVSLVLFAMMASAAAISYAVAPTAKMADRRGQFDLETRIPREFGDWKVDPTIVPLQVDPDTQARLNRIYNQTLSRTYINRDGERVMLSIAYGGDQSDNMGVHKPEVCYVAQGFDVRRNEVGEVATPHGNLPVRQLLAVTGARSEPITYWITIGDKITRPGIDQRLQELKIGLTGVVPDGMLVRVSTLDTDTSHAYGVQADFIRALIDRLPAADRARLIGTFNG